MDVNVSDIKIEIYHQYRSDFSRTRFDGERLGDFLNRQSTEFLRSGKKWQVEKDEKRPERVTIEDVVLNSGTGLHVDRFIIDEDSVLMSASEKGRKLTEEDERAKDWPELQRIRVMLAEFFALSIDVLNDPKQLYRSVYMSRTLGVELPVQFDQLLRPEIMDFLKVDLRPCYAERGMEIEVQPFAIAVKVNTTPNADAMKTLSPGQTKNLFSREDWMIGVQTYSDYDGRRFSYDTQMPFHQHVRTLRAFADVAAGLTQ